MINYIYQVSLCWGLFYLLYAVWLRKETFFQTNRWYLLSTLILGLLIPIFEFEYPTITANSQLFTPAYYLETITVTAQAVETNLDEIVITPVNNSWSAQMILIGIYWVGVLFFASRFFYGIFQIARLAMSGKILRKSGYTLIKTNKVHLPFSFMDYLFWSEEVDFTQEEHEKILQHELCHIKDKHSIDVLITELLSIFLWCSPFVFLYKNALKNIHEYLADHAVLKDTPTKNYGQLLLRQSQSGLQIAQANNFIHSQLKKRILMMTKTKSQRSALLKYAAIIPLLLVLVFSISAKNSFSELTNTTSELPSITKDTIPPVVTQVGGEDVYRVVDEMPRFKGCDDLSSQEQKACADKKMLMHIYTSIKYPALAREAGIQGTVVVSFIIKKDGTVSNPEIKRSIGGGCDEEVIRIVNSMPDFLPGKQAGKAVNVQYMLPVKFKLEGDTPKKASVQKEKLSLPILENDPLIIIDGKEASKMTEISPDDIKSIDILKDKVAIEKYGEKGKNGVVIIKTNKDAVTVVGYRKTKKKDLPSSSSNELEGEEVFKVVEQMPMFPNSSTKDESFKNLLEFLYSNIQYPAEAKEANIEGTVVVKFIVTKTGGIKSPKIIRSIGGGTDEEVLRVVDLMNELPEKWTPGKQRGKAVNVQFNLPVKFKLEGASKTKEEGKKAEKAELPKASKFDLVEVYPNPSDGEINIHFISKAEANTKVTITDISGKQIFQQEFGDKEVKLNYVELKNAATGLLTVTLSQGDEVVTKKVVLQK